jgi:hypothetical protein
MESYFENDEEIPGTAKTYNYEDENIEPVIEDKTVEEEENEPEEIRVNYDDIKKE